MKKLDNKTVAEPLTSTMTQMCGPSSNCQSGGCSCSKCFDSQASGNEEIKKVYEDQK